jgi:hypothetical protein
MLITFTLIGMRKLVVKGGAGQAHRAIVGNHREITGTFGSVANDAQPRPDAGGTVIEQGNRTADKIRKS